MYQAAAVIKQHRLSLFKIKIVSKEMLYKQYTQLFISEQFLTLIPLKPLSVKHFGVGISVATHFLR